MNKMKRKTLIITLGIVLVVLCGCLVVSGFIAFRVLNDPSIQAGLKRITSDLSDMADLQQKVLKAYPAQGVEVNIRNGRILNVSLVNSPYNQLSSSQQRTKAQEIARFVKDNYGGMSRVDAIYITFVERQQSTLINTNRFWTYTFDTKTLPP
jgi:hypothetical protein